MAERRYEPIEVYPLPAPVTHLNYKVLAGIAGGILALGIALTVLWHTGGTREPSPQEAPAITPTTGSDFTAGMIKHYDDIKPPSEPVKRPVAIPMAPIVPPPTVNVAQIPAPSPQPRPQQTFSVAPPVQPPTAPVVTTVQPPAPKPEKPKRQAWNLKPVLMNESSATAHSTGKGPEKDKEHTGQDGAQSLIKPATWSRPVAPLRTLYRSMLLRGVTMDEIHSDVKGMVRIRLSESVMDRFIGRQEILPKDSIIIASQVGQPHFGASRLEIKLDQIELVGGEVLALKATIGDERGAASMTGKLNSHYGKLALAAGLSAILNIGSSVAVGTPGRGEFYEDAGQRAAHDMSRSVQRDASSLIDKQLRVPPTIIIKAGTPCTIALGENIQLNRKPSIAK